MAQRSGRTLRIRRHRRVRFKVAGTAAIPRAAVFRSNKHISVQLIDDETGKTLASASSNTKGSSTTGSNRDAATKVGAQLAAAAKAAGISKIVFDRGGFNYHGRVAALADAMREGGLEF
jgi:large subunit ribosomal protein L18